MRFWSDQSGGKKDSAWEIKNHHFFKDFNGCGVDLRSDDIYIYIYIYKYIYIYIYIK